MKMHLPFRQQAQYDKVRGRDETAHTNAKAVLSGKVDVDHVPDYTMWLSESRGEHV
jgi:hypothetical protein